MDGLILTFTPEQLKKYNEIKCGYSSLPTFETSFDYSYDEEIDIIPTLEEMAENAKALLSYQKNDCFFASKMTKEEMEEFKASYFNMISNIEVLRKSLYAEISSLSQSILALDKECASLLRGYSKFLPYKAALYDSLDYGAEIKQIDGEFTSSIEEAKKYILHKKERLGTLALICDRIIPDFYKSITLHSGSPRFKEFNGGELFRDIYAFTEKINAIQKQKPM